VKEFSQLLKLWVFQIVEQRATRFTNGNQPSRSRPILTQFQPISVDKSPKLNICQMARQLVMFIKGA
jgi:hypothetical protein